MKITKKTKILAAIAVMSLGLMGSIVANAQQQPPAVKTPVLDKIIFQVSAERWVTTSEANVVVSVDASLEKEGLAKLRQKVQENLQRIAKADWRITQLNRSQDSSGLEKLVMQAEARVNEAALTNINQQAKDLSKPGITFKVEKVDFSPNLAEIEKTRNEVRALIYQQVNDEIAQLHKAYPKQSYTVNVIDFIGGLVPMIKQEGGRSSEPMMMAAPAAMSVSNKVEMTATVVVAATRMSHDAKDKDTND